MANHTSAGYDNARMPAWAKEHIRQCAVGPKPDESSNAFCQECIYWNPAFSSPASYDLDPSLKISQPEKTAPFIDQPMDNVWVTTDFFRECGFFDDMPEGVVEYAIRIASWFIHVKSGRQYPGLTKRIYQPGCLDKRCWDCCEPDVLELPGPINKVDFVAIDGEIIHGSNYRILDDNKLMNVGCEPWPNCQNFCRSPFTQWPMVADGNQQITIENNELDFFDQIAAEQGVLNTSNLDWIEEYVARNPSVMRRRRVTDKFLIGGDYRVEVGTCSLCSTNACGTTPCPPKAFRLEPVGKDHIIYEPTSTQGWRSIWLRYTPDETLQPCDLDGIDLSEAPWWVQKYVDPDYDQPKQMPLPSAEYDSWVNAALGQVEPNDPSPQWVVNETDSATSETEYKCSVVRHREDTKYTEALNWSSYIDQHQCSDDPSWAISYWAGRPVPEQAQMAAAAMAREIARSICDPGCLPSSIARIQRHELDVKFLDRRDLLNANRTGIIEVDNFLQTVNPRALRRRAYIVNPGTKKRQMHRVRPANPC